MTKERMQRICNEALSFSTRLSWTGFLGKCRYRNFQLCHQEKRRVRPRSEDSKGIFVFSEFKIILIDYRYMLSSTARWKEGGRKGGRESGRDSPTESKRMKWDGSQKSKKYKEEEER